MTYKAVYSLSTWSDTNFCNLTLIISQTLQQGKTLTSLPKIWTLLIVMFPLLFLFFRGWEGSSGVKDSIWSENYGERKYEENVWDWRWVAFCLNKKISMTYQMSASKVIGPSQGIFSVEVIRTEVWRIFGGITNLRSNILNTGKNVSFDFQTSRSGLEKIMRHSEVFLNQF